MSYSPDVFGRAVETAIAERERLARTSSYFWDFEAWHHYMTGGHIWSKQRAIAQDLEHHRNIAVKAAHGVGKLVSYGTPIPTPSGWTLAGELREGDYVLDEEGKSTRITSLSTVWDREQYTITFDDGSQIEAGAEHEWDVLDLTTRKKDRVEDWRDHWDQAVTVETQEMFALGTKTTAGQNRWRIPLAQPLQLPEADLPVDPYTLGLWLGDGSSHTGIITLGEAKIGALEHVPYTTEPRWVENKNAYTVSVIGLDVDLARTGVLNNKHIPMAYLRASEAQRRALLAGIMDADGFQLHNNNSVGIDMTNKRLSEDIYELLMTLGCKVFWKEGEAAYTKGGERHARYRMNWTPLENPFRVRGQDWQAPEAQRSRHTQRTIVSIEKTGRVQNFCIEVDSPRSLYLAGRSFVPTHNSYLVAALICWWVDTRYPHVFVASTAPSTAQIGAIVWREIRKMYSLINRRFNEGIIDHKLPGKINEDNRNNEWKGPDGQLIGFGRKPPDGKEDDNFQGIHEGHVLAVGDEAVGLSGEMIDALANITSNKNSRRIIIANPTNPASYMGQIFREDTGAWKLHTISVFDSPHFTEEKHEIPEELLEHLTGHDYVEEKKLEYGENSARYKARVLGEFAFDSGDTLITYEDIVVAAETEIEPLPSTRPELGVDIARFGKDKSVVYVNEMGRIRYVDSWAKADIVESANRVHRIAKEYGARVVKIDGMNIGGGVIDNLAVKADRTYEIVAMHGSGETPDYLQWHNARAFWWDDFRRRCREGKIDLDIEDTRLIDELLSVEYKFSKTPGGLLVEHKDDMARRGVKSPDFADAAIYAAANMQEIVDDPLGRAEPGDFVFENMDDLSSDFWIGW